jgi:hypothetical protein
VETAEEININTKSSDNGIGIQSGRLSVIRKYTVESELGIVLAGFRAGFH